MTFTNKEGIPLQIKAQVAIWVLGILFTLILGLVGVVYSNVDTRIKEVRSEKSDLDIVQGMEKRIDSVQKSVDKVDGKVDAMLEILAGKRK